METNIQLQFFKAIQLTRVLKGRRTKDLKKLMFDMKDSNREKRKIHDCRSKIYLILKTSNFLIIYLQKSLLMRFLYLQVIWHIFINLFCISQNIQFIIIYKLIMLPILPPIILQDDSISPQFNKHKYEIKNESDYDESYHSLTQPSDQYLTKKNINNYYKMKSVRNISVINPQQKKQHTLRKIKQKLNSIKPTSNICNNQKCKVCKPLISQKKQLRYAHHKKTKPPLPSLPTLKSSSVKKYQYYPEFNQNKHQHRRIRSVVQTQPNDLYVYEDPIARQRKPYYQQYVQYKLPKRHYYTQPQQNERKIFQINGKLYEQLSQDDIIQSISAMPIPIKKERRPQVAQLIQPIIRYSQKWKDEQVEKVKKREQLNKWVNQYVSYQTVFFMESKGIKMNFKQNPDNQTHVNKIHHVQRYKLKQVSKQIEKLPMNQQKKYDPDQIVENFLQLVPIKSNQVKVQKKIVTIKQQDRRGQQYQQLYQIKFPAVSQVEQSISKYQSLTGEIVVESLRNSKTYFREYCDELDKQFLYFGEYDHKKAQRKGLGVLVTQNFILQGHWMDGNIIKGAELKPKFIYKGQFKNNKKHGDGTCKWLNNQEYVGQWNGGFKHGHGSWISFDGNQTYSGQWKKGKVTGYGQYCIKNKSLYKGFFVDFVKNGHGFQHFLNGDKYQGEYLDGVPSGKGIYTWQCGLKYEGEFKKASREGKGRLTKEQVFQIQGEFQNQKPHGICQLKLVNGDIFNGKYVYGQKYGFGTQQYNNSSIREQGFWNHDMLQQKLNLQTFIKRNS